MNKNNKKILLLSAVAILGIVCLSLAVTFARYVANAAWDYYLSSRGFYLTSDHLAKDPIQNINNSWHNESIYFNVRNSAGEDATSDFDIEYEVSCEVESHNELECHLNGTSSDVFNGILSAYQSCTNDTGDNVVVSEFSKKECELGGYIWQSTPAVSDIYFDVIGDISDISGVEVKISLKSTSPYRKTLTGNFILNKPSTNLNEILSSYNDFTNYGRYNVINTYNEAKCFSLEWNADDLLIDSINFTESYKDLNGNIEKIEFKLAKTSSISYLFLKPKLNVNQTINNFNLDKINCN